MSSDFLARIQIAQQNGEDIEWVVMGIMLENQDPAIQEAVWAAAIPQWFDNDFLATLLDEADFQSFQSFGGIESLTKLSFVKYLPGRGYYIDEKNRFLLVRHLKQEKYEQFKKFTERAAIYCNRKETVLRIQNIFFHITNNLPGSKEKLRDQALEWCKTLEFDKLEALIKSILEMEGLDFITEEVLAWAYYFKSRLFLANQVNKIYDAKTMLEKALQYNTDDQTLRAYGKHALGDIYLQLSQYNRAIQNYESAYLSYLYQKITDSEAQAECLKGIGDAYFLLNRHGQSEKCYRLALSICQQNDLLLKQASCLKALAEVCQTLGKLSTPRSYFEESLHIYQQIHDPLGQFNCLLFLADLDYREGFPGKAKEKYTEILDMQQFYSISFELALAYDRLGFTAENIIIREEADHHYKNLNALSVVVELPDTSMLDNYDTSAQLAVMQQQDILSTPIVLNKDELFKNYASIVLAIENDKNETIGTAFLVFSEKHIYAVTCAHVIQDLQKTIEDEIFLQHFHPEIGQLKAVIRWLGAPKATPSKNWTAKQDIALLELITEIPEDISPLPFDPSGTPINYQGKTECWCFGFVRIKQPRGSWIEGISCKKVVGMGFVELSQPRDGAKIEGGASGAPLCDIQGNILGMVQSIFGKEDAYLIPAKYIIDTCSSLIKNLRKVDHQ